MPRIVFNSRLRGVVPLEPITVAGTTVRDSLARVFADYPRLQGYVLDDQGSVRQHVAIYVNDRPIVDRLRQSDAVEDQTEIYVLQALTGG